MIRPFALVLILVAVSATAAEQQRAIPARFQGEWNTKLEHCGTDRNDSRLRISADHIQFHESGGPVRAIVTQGELDLAVIAEMSGEGETWLFFRNFRLSADHAYMTDVTDKDFGIVCYRCPKGSK
jgi:hypothetical protein